VTIANTEGAKFWSEMAPTWVTMEEDLEQISGYAGELAMERLAPQPGERLLDIGCGTGRTTLALARRVAPGGKAVGLDIAEGMLAHARRQAEEHAVGEVEFRQGDAQVEDLGEASFDGAYSRFGVMFFADPVTAFANIRRALRRDGRLSFVCWQAVLQNEWMLVPAGAAISATGATPEMPGPDEPGPFAFADAERLASILGSAEFRDVAIEQVNDSVLTAEADIAKFAVRSSGVGMVRELLRDADDEKRQIVLRAIEEAMRSRLDEGVVRLSRGFHVVTAVA
jgi:SAM-dependent methyltransferase